MVKDPAHCGRLEPRRNWGVGEESVVEILKIQYSLMSSQKINNVKNISKPPPLTGYIINTNCCKGSILTGRAACELLREFQEHSFHEFVGVVNLLVPWLSLNHKGSYNFPTKNKPCWLAKLVLSRIISFVCY